MKHTASSEPSDPIKKGYAVKAPAAEVGFVTKRALATFSGPVGLMLDGMVVMTQAAICEYEEPKGVHLDEMPSHLKVIGLSDRKLSKTLTLIVPRYGMGAICSLMILDDEDQV